MLFNWRHDTNRNYGFGKKVGASFDQAVERVIQELQKEGFGVLTDIDVAATLKKKLNQDMPPYGILTMILAANAVVARARPARVEGWFLGLGAAILLPFLVPLGALNALPFAARATLGALFVSLPILFAGVVFATSFRKAPAPSAALASNLFGALAGGVLEYGSMFFGIRSLNPLALALYGLAFLALRRRPHAFA